ncbi:MAPEG family protein [Amylibacter sp. IMCC11727]|uniref:MAPEG family protein n=1 Tax=Amylibacter sp. IMCC11727 TaxID=3039851 RepID=UPI00244DA1FC|nr:MAPEG family protein [Amylibacter sp. IMCC11727]WGI23029.1 MAPEG family protein [Amylibacter sp. IMCC11727]
MSDFPLNVTAAAAVILGAMYIFMTFQIGLQRGKERIAMGDNGDPVLAKKIRGHANAAEQIPLGLILIGLNEAMNSAPTAMVLAALLVLGRIAHAIHFFGEKKPLVFRAGGMMLTILSHLLGVIGLALGLIL